MEDRVVVSYITIKYPRQRNLRGDINKLNPLTHAQTKLNLCTVYPYVMECIHFRE